MTTPELPPISSDLALFHALLPTDERDTYWRVINSIEARERILLDRIEELGADAARYRWLRNAISCRIVSHTTGELTSNYVEWYHLSAQFGAGSLDAAIDAAREAKP